MDFKIITDFEAGTAMMSWDKEDSIRGNIFFSLNIIPGSIFNNPTFGLKLDDIKKITTASIELIHQRITNSLQWIIDVGKATSIVVLVEKDDLDKNRINIKIEAVQSDGTALSYSQFLPVGGPSDGFVTP